MAGERAIRVGVPWRTSQEEAASKRDAFEKYLDCVRAAGAEPVELSLGLGRAQLGEVVQTLDAFVLPGSPADVDPQWYHAERQEKTAEPDKAREETDFALIDQAVASRKPLLAVCYGTQTLNVSQGGTLIQDVARDLGTDIQHQWKGQKQGAPEPHHAILIETESELSRLAGGLQVTVNSSHHQSIGRVGRGLRVTAKAPDGVIEALEFLQPEQWIVGVQWHPERTPDDRLTQGLFAALVGAAARTAAP